MSFTGKSSAKKPAKQARNLTQTIVERIAADIANGTLAVGAKLPTEHELMAMFRVSRTVVREAVAALKADGVVVTRQGSGAFVTAQAKRAAFRLEEGEALQDIIDVLELRLALEVEAAGLAAQRATAVDRNRILEALAKFVAAVEAGGNGADEDFALHLAIAEAAANRQFPQFLRFLGTHSIPRHNLPAEPGSKSKERAYLAQLRKEHERIVGAILAADAGAACRAMRNHLVQTQHHYRSLAQRYVGDASDHTA